MNSTMECRLINRFEHDHEMSQYLEIRNALTSASSSSRLQGVLLGNVMCGSASLDSLLLTPYGVFVVEFKSYPKVHTVRVNGQRKFVCCDSTGAEMRDASGMTLTVKGGCQDSPFDQARINRRLVREKLVSVFGETIGNGIHVGVIILFKGQTQIKGLEQFEERELKWLTMVNSSNLKSFFSVAPDLKTRGLDSMQQKQLADRLDANCDLLSVSVVSKPRAVTMPVNPEPRAELSFKSCSKSELTNKASRNFDIAGRVAASVTYLLMFIFAGVMLLPANNYKFGLVLSVLALLILGVLVGWCWNSDDFDHWFIRKNMHDHYHNMGLRTIEVRSQEWDFIRTALVSSCVVIFLAILVMFFLTLDHFVGVAFHWMGNHEGWWSKIVSAGQRYTFFNPLNIIRVSMWIYFIIHLAGYVWAIVTSASTIEGEDSKVTRSGLKIRVWHVPVPRILNGCRLELGCGVTFALHSLVYGVGAVLFIGTVSLARPILYTLFGI